MASAAQPPTASIFTYELFCNTCRITDSASRIHICMTCLISTSCFEHTTAHHFCKKSERDSADFRDLINVRKTLALLPNTPPQTKLAFIRLNNKKEIHSIKWMDPRCLDKKNPFYKLLFAITENRCKIPFTTCLYITYFQNAQKIDRIITARAVIHLPLPLLPRIASAPTTTKPTTPKTNLDSIQFSPANSTDDVDNDQVSEQPVNSDCDETPSPKGTQQTNFSYQEATLPNPSTTEASQVLLEGVEGWFDSENTELKEFATQGSQLSVQEATKRPVNPDCDENHETPNLEGTQRSNPFQDAALLDQSTMEDQEQVEGKEPPEDKNTEHSESEIGEPNDNKNSEQSPSSSNPQLDDDFPDWEKI